MNKPVTIYNAFIKAVDGFNMRQNTCRRYLADLLGYRGDNASIQFSNALNPNNESKMLNHAKEEILLHALDDIAVKEYFTERMRAFGLRPVSICPVTITAVSFHEAIDNAMIEGDEAFKVTKRALKDKVLTSDELRDIIKESREASVKYQEIVDMAEVKLGEQDDK